MSTQQVTELHFTDATERSIAQLSQRRRTVILAV